METMEKQLILHGYELDMPFQNKDAGFSRWTFGHKDGEAFFLKELLNPVYPLDDSLPEDMREAARSACREMEEEKQRIFAEINRVSDGNLTRVTEFFRHRSHYYIVMPRIEANIETDEKLAKVLDEGQKRILLRTIANSIMHLHSAKLIHADLKASNVLLRMTPKGIPIAKIVDYGNCFFENEQPKNADDFGGDQVYLSPEGCRFIFGEPVELTCKLDIYSMGLMFHEFLTGQLPYFDRKEYDYPYEAVLEGEPLVVSDEIGEPYRDLIRRMLECDPERRIDIYEVCRTLGFSESEIQHWSRVETRPPIVRSRQPEPKREAFEEKKFDPMSFFSMAGDL